MWCCCFARPLADSEKLPVRAHRAAEAPKSPIEDGDAASQEPMKKSSKEKQEKKKDKDRDRKVRFKSLLFTMEDTMSHLHWSQYVKLVKLFYWLVKGFSDIQRN